MSRITSKGARALTPTIPVDDGGGLEPDDLLDSAVQGGDKPGHWSAGELLARAE